jgi:hypothetical protein
MLCIPEVPLPAEGWSQAAESKYLNEMYENLEVPMEIAESCFIKFHRHHDFENITASSDRRLL